MQQGERDESGGSESHSKLATHTCIIRDFCTPENLHFPMWEPPGASEKHKIRQGPIEKQERETSRLVVQTRQALSQRNEHQAVEENRRSGKTSVVTRKGRNMVVRTRLPYCGAFDASCSNCATNKTDLLTCVEPDSCRACGAAHHLEDLAQSLCPSGRPMGREDICRMRAEALAGTSRGCASGERRGNIALSGCWGGIVRETARDWWRWEVDVASKRKAECGRSERGRERKTRHAWNWCQSAGPKEAGLRDLTRRRARTRKSRDRRAGGPSPVE